MDWTLEGLGNKAKAALALIALCGMILSGLAIFAKASELKEVEAKLTQMWAENTRDDKVYRIRENIHEIQDEMRKIENTYGVEDPLQIPNIRDREYYRDLKDQLEYFKHELEKVEG